MQITPSSSVTDDDSVKRAIVEQLVFTTIPPRLSRWGWKDPARWIRSVGSMGLRGLMPLDASITPFVPSAPPNLATVMIAEHAARHRSLGDPIQWST